jgi:hypothetical protein
VRPRIALIALLAVCAIILCIAPASAREILLVDLSQADAPTQMLVASIQGVVNRDISTSGIYVVAAPQDPIWLMLYPGDVTAVKPDELVTRVKDRLDGQVLYDPAQTDSVNLAAAAAGILDAALTTTDLGLKTLFDARGRWPDRLTAYRYAVAQVMAQSAPDRLAVIGAERVDLRDYFAKDRILAVDLDWQNEEQANLLREILARLKPGSLTFGAQELVSNDQFLRLLALRQDLLVPASYAANLSFHSAYPVTMPLHQLDHIAPLAYEIMVTFVYEGGTDLGFALGPMRVLWNDPARGTFPLGWTISPALLDVAPAVYQSYCADAWLGGADELVMAPNGPGYFVPSRQREWTPILDRMAPWVRAGDLRTIAILDKGPAADLQRALPEYRKAGLRGFLLGPGSQLNSGLYGLAASVAQTVRATDPYEALLAIRKAAETDKYIYVSVDPASLSPRDIAYIAGRLGSRYMLLRPREFLEVARQTTATHRQKPKEGSATITDIAIEPSTPGPEAEVEVRATVRSPVELDSVLVVYSVAGGPQELTALLEPGPEDAYAGKLPPFLAGGKVSARIRAGDVENGVTWSDPFALEVTAPDADSDGLSDAVEKLLRTDPNKPDTDRDGWRDANDAHPLIPDHLGAVYLWPLVPPGEASYIVQGGGSVAGGVRSLTGDEQVVYELPLSNAPPESRPLFQAVIGGDYRLEASSDLKQWQDIGSATTNLSLGPGAWPVPADYIAAGHLFVRVTDSTPEGGAPAKLAGLSIFSNPDGPSIVMAGTEPAFPAVGMTTRVLATVFDPQSVADVKLYYRINDGGTIGVPMQERGSSQVFAAAVHGAADGDTVTYWVTAADAKENAAASRPLSFYVGIAPKETVSLLPERDCEGEWQLGSEWDGSRWSPRKGAVDHASINITSGSYRVWVLAAPRGAGIEVAIDGRTVGATQADARDGWQSLGTVDLERGRRQVTLTSTGDARCGYAQVLVTQDRATTPPPDMVRDLFNSITVISPRPGDKVEGLLTIEATGTGNVAAVECAIDGGRLGREDTAPYRFRWNARRAAVGSHEIQLQAYDSAGDPLLSTSLKVEVSR